jgi:hypothetical protein
MVGLDRRVTGDRWVAAIRWYSERHATRADPLSRRVPRREKRENKADHREQGATRSGTNAGTAPGWRWHRASPGHVLASLTPPQLRGMPRRGALVRALL